MNKRYWRFIPLILLMLLVIFFWRGLSLDPQLVPSVQIGKALPAFKLPALEPHQAALTPAMMQGHVVLLNVWASWCDACASEQLFLLQLKRQGVAIYGLNYKDNADEAKQWLAQWGNPYQLVGADVAGNVAIDLGVYGAPEMFLVDKTGIIRHRHVGVVDALVWKREFLPLMKQLERVA